MAARKSTRVNRKYKTNSGSSQLLPRCRNFGTPLMR